MKYADYDELHLGGGMMGKGPDDDENTLRSDARANIVFLLGEGETVGVREGLKWVYLDDTQVQSERRENIKGVLMSERVGTPNQKYLHRFDDVQNVISVGRLVEHGLPVVQSLIDGDFNKAIVTLQFPALFHSTKDGVKKFSVTYRIEVRYDGGSWENPFKKDITLRGKNASPYERQYEFDLPENPSGDSHPWDVRVTRVTGDTSGESKQDDIYFSTLTGVIDRKFIYPDCALLGLTLNAKHFDGSVPRVAVEGEGRIIKVPSNYDPVSREYDESGGGWDGTFKNEYSTNPAWVYYDMLINDRFGMGQFVKPSMVDKWTLYDIGKVCDTPVWNGYGRREPLFEINVIIREAKDAYEMMQLIASAFRGMAYWSSGAVTATQDVLGPVRALLTKANTIDGKFAYKGTALPARHNSIYVNYRDQRDDFRPAVEIVQDRDNIDTYGENIKEVKAFGCTSRSMARRLGLWIMYTELHETQTLSYKAGMDHAHRRPGDIIHVMDPEISNLDNGGRTLAGSTTTSLLLDRPVELESGVEYTLYVMMPNGTVEGKAILSPAGTLSTVLTMPFSDVPIDGAVWILSSVEVEPKKYRIVGLQEAEPHVYDVTALEVWEPKYNLIEQDKFFTSPNYRDEDDIAAPEDLKFEEYWYHRNGVPRAGLLISWKAPSYAWSPRFFIQIDAPDDERSVTLTNLREPIYDLKPIQAGTYTVTVQLLSPDRKASAELTGTFTAQGLAGMPLIDVENLRIVGDSNDTNIFYSKDVTIAWNNAIEDGPSNTLSYKRTRIRVYNNADPMAPALLRTDFTQGERYTYGVNQNKKDGPGNAKSRYLKFVVSNQDALDRYGDAVELEVANPPIDAPLVTATGSKRRVDIDWEKPDDKDYQGTHVHIGGSFGFTPSEGNRVFNGRQSAVSRKLDPGDYYVKVGHFDSFNSTPVNYSDAISFNIGDDQDTTPPADPTGLDVTAEIIQNGAGETVARMTAVWDANVEDDLAGYILQYRYGTGGEWIGRGWLDETVHSWNADSGFNLYVRIKAFDQAANKSGWLQFGPLLTPGDTTAPAAAAGLGAVARPKMIRLRWNRCTAPDYAETIIYRNTVNNSGTAVELDRKRGTEYKDSDDLTAGDTYYYWAAHVDRSGNIGGLSSVASATWRKINDDDTDDSTLDAPTSLILTKVQEKDEDGTIRTFIRMSCTAPAWANGKTTYEFEVTVGGNDETVESGGPKKRYRVNKTGVLHSIRVRAIRGVGTKGDWTSASTITPTKKASDASAVTGVSSHRKNGNNVVKWNAVSDPDNREVVVKRATTNSYGAASEIGRTKANRFVDTDVNSKGTNYYYFVDPVDTSGNVGAASASTSQTENGIIVTDTDTTLLAAPTSITLFQANKDLNGDGTVDIALRTVCGGLVSGASGYEFQWLDNAGQTATARADSGTAWFSATTARSYQVRWRTITWNGQPGPWSSYTSSVTPSTVTGAPANPTGMSVTPTELGYFVFWAPPSELDYAYTQIAVLPSPGTPSSVEIIGTETSNRGIVFGATLSGYFYIRHFNTSGLASSWVTTGVNHLRNGLTRSGLAAGAAGAIAHNNSGTTIGSVNAGSATRTFLSLSFKMTNSASGVTITLGSYSVTIDFEADKQATFTTSETGGGSFTGNKSSGTIANCQITAIGIH